MNIDDLSTVILIKESPFYKEKLLRPLIDFYLVNKDKSKIKCPFKLFEKFKLNDHEYNFFKLPFLPQEKKAEQFSVFIGMKPYYSKYEFVFANMIELEQKCIHHKKLIDYYDITNVFTLMEPANYTIMKDQWKNFNFRIRFDSNEYFSICGFPSAKATLKNFNRTIMKKDIK